MNHRRSMRLSVALAIAVAPVALAQSPTKAPAPLPVRPAAIPPFQEARLANGLRILLVESKRQPVVSLALMLNAGDAFAPARKEGIATLAASLVTKGAAGRAADDVSSAIEGVGGSLAATSSEDFFTLRANVLAENAPLAFELVGDAIARPRFDSKELELARTQLLSALQLEQSQPASLASRYFAAQLFGAHPYGRHPNVTAVQGIGVDDLRAYQKTRLVPAGSLLVVAGDITIARTKELAQKWMGNWAGTAAPVAKRAAPPMRATTEILLVHRPGSVQSNIIVGNLTYLPNSPSYYPLTVANRALGGGTDSRLFRVLREQKSWTYGAYSSLARNRDIGTFQATAEVRNAVTDSALTELLSIERNLGSAPLKADELDAARNALVGSLPLRIETAQGVAEQVGLYTMLGLPMDFIRTLRPRLAAVNAADIQRAAHSFMQPDKSLIVVVGDGAQIYDKLAKIAPTRIVNAQGDAMQPSDLVAKATTLPVDVSKLAEHADSFTVMVQGNPFGYQTSSLKKTGAGFAYTETAVLGPIIQQTVTGNFGADLVPVSSKGSGKVQGQAIAVDVSYANGRAKGSGSTPAATGPKTVQIDTVIAPGTLDDNMLLPLVAGLKWAPSTKYSFAAFDASTGATKQLTAAVVATESVTVPAGTFQAYKVEVTGADQTRVLYLTTTGSTRIVKMTIAGTPIELLLVK